jgi:hypothetical protein
LYGLWREWLPRYPVDAYLPLFLVERGVLEGDKREGRIHGIGCLNAERNCWAILVAWWLYNESEYSGRLGFLARNGMEFAWCIAKS